MGFLEAFGVIIVAALLAGSSAGMLGVFVIGLRIPFLVVCMAHAALAGAVFGEMAGFSHKICGFAGAGAAALVLGWLLRTRRLDPNAALGTLFALTMGLAFLGIGLSPGPKSQALGLVWGSLLFVTRTHLVAMAIVAGLLLLFITALGKELKVLLFSRDLASALAPEPLIFTGLLVLAAGVVAVSLEIVGGLLLYALICNPAVAGLSMARSYRGALLLSSLLGALSASAGFFAACWLNLPAGACIVLASTLLTGIVFAFAGHEPLQEAETT